MDEKFLSAADPAARRFILIGGFLGAGKTTLIGQFSRYLKDRGLKVGLVTNDQGEGLMDTDSASNSGAQGVEEITGGCFVAVWTILSVPSTSWMRLPARM